MTTTTPLHAVYCEGWDAERRAVVGRLTAATARERDRSGEQYAVAVIEPQTHTVVAVLEIAWSDHFARCWHLDVRGRRHAVDEFRELDGRMFLLRSAEWGYDDPEQPEFDEERARHEEVKHHPDGTATRTTQPQGGSGPMRVTTVLTPVEDLYLDVPRFGEWGGLIRSDAELVVQPDPSADETVEPPWRPAAPLRPERLGLVFQPDVRWTLAKTDHTVVTELRDGGTVRLPSGRLVVADPAWLSVELEPFTATVRPGDYGVELAVVRFVTEEHRRVAAAKLVVSTEPVASWEPALTAGQNPVLLGDGAFFGFGVDAGTACFVDGDVLGEMERILEESCETVVGIPAGETVEVREPESGATLVAFGSGWGDGAYPTWVGRTADGDIACFVADMLVLHGATAVQDEHEDQPRSARVFQNISS
ncbi:hypothetical protein F4560_002044 [Saccharothrix ecbatanensis]|uniref:DUF4241 domain-containing protein n=1 Tax=Saccharothrix ecbatanensis TaxID=1105145 RepID=A0A7W9HHS2_9PSEU|nr:DUF4241 domain-containing protein [Saccharothrix ecbatanensis]MBB5802276.1 hypothetical protein [Saccharothrix ecbatanensis]